MQKQTQKFISSLKKIQKFLFVTLNISNLHSQFAKIKDPTKIKAFKILFFVAIIISLAFFMYMLRYIIELYTINDGINESNIRKEKNIVSEFQFIEPESKQKKTFNILIEERQSNLEDKIKQLLKDLDSNETKSNQNVSEVSDELKKLAKLLETIDKKHAALAQALEDKLKNDHNVIPNDRIYNFSRVVGANKLKKVKKNYLPPGTIIPAKLLTGIIAKTGVEVMSDPVPLLARVVGMARLPDGDTLDLKQCKIIMSGYGDLSSAAIIARPERLICRFKNSDEYIETALTGVVTNQGFNLIPGKVSLINQKHVANAWLSGILSDIFSSASAYLGKNVFDSKSNQTSENQNLPNNDLKQAFLSKIFEDSSKGASSGMQKITEYYIKKAENLQPIIQVGQGQKVEIFLTAGSWLNDSVNDLKQRIDKERQ